MSLLISIIIPTYNRSHTIENCIKKLQYQSYSNIEIIIIDDASTDGTWEILKTLAQDDARIIIKKLSENSGPMTARYEGIKISKGDYICFCDSDDEMPITAIEIFISCLAKNNYSPDVIVGQYELQFSSTNKRKISISSPFEKSKVGFYKSLLSGKIPPSLWGKLYRASLLRDKPYIIHKNMLFAEDKLMLYQIADNISTFSTIDDIVYTYKKEGPSTTSQRYNFKHINDSTKTLKWIYSHFKTDPDIKDFMYDHLARSFVDIATIPYNAVKVINNIEDKASANYLGSINFFKKYSKKGFKHYFIIKLSAYPFLSSCFLKIIKKIPHKKHFI